MALDLPVRGPYKRYTPPWTALMEQRSLNLLKDYL